MHAPVVIQGDCIAEMRRMAENSVDAVVTDPPAGISFMSKTWDSDKGGRDQWIAWLAEVMAECLRVLKPGGHALVWALPRTSHWTGMALEEAGFEVRDRITHLFGSGFPKSLDVSKALDKVAGAEREVVGISPRHGGGTNHIYGEGMGDGVVPMLTAPATDLAKRYAGFGTALKPAAEDWWLARKPLAGTVASNVAQFSTGALNIDATRIGPASDKTPAPTRRGDSAPWFTSASQNLGGDDSKGRWPANVVLGCNCFRDEFPDPELVPHDPDCAAALLDAQSGERAAGRFPGTLGQSNFYSQVRPGKQEPRQMDTGGASRFYLNVKTDSQCWLCGCEYGLKDGILNVCHAPNVEPISSPSEPVTASAPAAAEPSLPLGAGGKSGSSTSTAISAAEPSANTPVTLRASSHTAPADAPMTPAEQIARSVSDAGGPCGRCATAIAHALVALSRNLDPASPLSRASMPAHRKPILLRSLALLAESLGSTATTPTIPALKMWCGYVRHAIESSTPSEYPALNSESGPLRFGYHSKASRREREAGLEGMPEGTKRILNSGIPSAVNSDPRGMSGGGDRKAANTHPTVKPLALMRWLCRLVTPPGGLILDPFTGSGSTGCAAVLEGFRFTGIEQSEDYCAIARRRIAHWTPVQPDLEPAA